MSDVAAELGGTRLGQVSDDPADTVRSGAARLRELAGAPGYTHMLATMLGYLADHSDAPDSVLAARTRAFALEAARAALHEHPAAAPTTGETGEDWYGGTWGWDNPQLALRAAVPVLAEMAGAGVVAADAGDADDIYWRGYSNDPHWDARGDRRRVDVKRAWTENADTLGFPGPTKPDQHGEYRYDQDCVDDIMLVHLQDQDVTTEHGYEPEGSVFLAMRGKPLAAYRVPVPAINNMIKSKVIRRVSKLRFVVPVQVLAPYQVRGPRHGNGNPSPMTAVWEDTEKRPEPFQGEQTT